MYRIFLLNFHTFSTSIFRHHLIYVFQNVPNLLDRIPEYLKKRQLFGCRVPLKFKDPAKSIMYLIQAESFLRHRADNRLWKISIYNAKIYEKIDRES